MSKTQKQEIIESLKKVTIFSAFYDKPQDLQKIADIMSAKHAGKDEFIINEGDEGDTLFILKSGSVRILKKTLADEMYTVVDLKNPGNIFLFFGELALLDNDKRSASIQAKEDCDLYIVRRDDFNRLGDKYPHIALPITREISKVLASRLRRSNQDTITLFEALVGEVEDEE